MVTLRRSGEEFSTFMFMASCQGFELNIRDGFGSTSPTVFLPPPSSTTSPDPIDIPGHHGPAAMGGTMVAGSACATIHPQLVSYRVAGLESWKLVGFRAK